MTEALLVGMMLIFAVQAIRTPHLLTAALWLAGISALLAIFFYRLGATQVAVIELSVGAGLVTVLFVFAISMAGEEFTPIWANVPRSLAISLALIIVVLLGTLSLPLDVPATETAEAPLTQVFWEERGLDVLVQVILIFSGVLGLLGLLAEVKAPLEKTAAVEVTAKRDQELLELQQKTLR
jgi:uncharacterized MnhB-related membrane protein